MMTREHDAAHAHAAADVLVNGVRRFGRHLFEPPISVYRIPVMALKLDKTSEYASCNDIVKYLSNES